jgi:selenocysteine-specific elongation factor
MDGPAIAPGGRGLAQLRFAQPVIAHAGLRAILRRPSPAETIGGALVLDPVAPPLRARTLAARRDLLTAASGGPLEAIADQLARSGGGVLSLVDLARLARRPLAQLEADLQASFKPLGEGLMAAPQALADARQAYLDHLAEAHDRQPTRPGLPLGSVRSGLAALPLALVAQVERDLALSGDIRLEAGLVALRGHDPVAALSPDSLSRLGQIEAEIRAGGISPPDIRALEGQTPEDAALVTLLIDTGRLVSLYNHALRQTLTFHAEAFDQAADDLRVAFPPPTLFTTGEARAALNTSRKFIVPVLELLDRRGDTVRQGDQRQLTGGENPLPVPPEPI